MAGKKVSPATVGLALLAAGEVPNFLAGMLPSLMTIRRFGAEPEDVATLREGEVIGSVLALSVGLGGSLASGHPLPFIASAVYLAAMLYAYERAIRNPHASATPINQQQPRWGY